MRLAVDTRKSHCAVASQFLPMRNCYVLPLYLSLLLSIMWDYLYSYYDFIFIPLIVVRQYAMHAERDIVMTNPSVRLSVCPTRYCIVFK